MYNSPFDPCNQRVHNIRQVGKDGSLESEIEEWTRIIDSKPSSRDLYIAHRERGFAYFDLKNYEAAIRDLQEAALTDPTNDSIMNRLMEAYEFTGKRKDPNPAMRAIIACFDEMRKIDWANDEYIN